MRRHCSVRRNDWLLSQHVHLWLMVGLLAAGAVRCSSPDEAQEASSASANDAIEQAPLGNALEVEAGFWSEEAARQAEEKPTVSSAQGGGRGGAPSAEAAESSVQYVNGYPLIQIEGELTLIRTFEDGKLTSVSAPNSDITAMGPGGFTDIPGKRVLTFQVSPGESCEVEGMLFVGLREESPEFYDLAFFVSKDATGRIPAALRQERSRIYALNPDSIFLRLGPRSPDEQDTLVWLGRLVTLPDNTMAVSQYRPYQPETMPAETVRREFVLVCPGIGSPGAGWERRVEADVAVSRSQGITTYSLQTGQFGQIPQGVFIGPIEEGARIGYGSMITRLPTSSGAMVMLQLPSGDGVLQWAVDEGVARSRGTQRQRGDVDKRKKRLEELMQETQGRRAGDRPSAQELRKELEDLRNELTNHLRQRVE